MDYVYREMKCKERRRRRKIGEEVEVASRNKCRSISQSTRLRTCGWAGFSFSGKGGYSSECTGF